MPWHWLAGAPLIAELQRELDRLTHQNTYLSQRLDEVLAECERNAQERDRWERAFQVLNQQQTSLMHEYRALQATLAFVQFAETQPPLRRH